MPPSPTSTLLSWSAQRFIDHHLSAALATCPTEQCCICQETYHSSRELRADVIDIPGCTHHFGLDCLMQYLCTDPYSTKQCPMCRTQWVPLTYAEHSSRSAMELPDMARADFLTASAPRSTPDTSTPSQRTGSGTAMPLVESYIERLSALGVIPANLANLLRLLQLREDLAQLQTDIARTEERRVARRVTDVSAREAAVVAREAALTTREQAVTVREQAMQEAADLSIRHSDEVRALVARQQEDLVRAMGEAQVRDR